MKHLKDYFWSMACLMMMGAAMVSCDDDDNDNGEPDGGADRRVAYILYEGNGGSNNSGIARFSPSGASGFVGNFFYTRNRFGLGDTAMSFDEEDGNLYCVVSGSKNVVRMDRNCIQLVRHSFDPGEGVPRYLVVEDGYVYVTKYGGKVSKLDATTLEEVASFKGGNNLEGIAEHNGKLYVANAYKNDNGEYVYNTEVLVIDAASMQLDRSLDVTVNPEILKEIDDKIFLISRGDYGVVQPTLQVINPDDNSVRVIGNASKITEGKNGRLYVVYSNTTYDENWNAATVTTYFTYNMRTGQVENTSFLKNAPAELGSGNVYLLEMDDETEEIYVGLTDYVTNGTIYRFDRDGNLMETFDAGGINPSSVLFVEND